MKLTAVVIRYDLKKKDEVDCTGKIISKDKKYAYSVMISTNPDLKGREIINFYEKRWGSEEDFRQLKDYWNMNKFTTTRYEGILLELICCVIAYALYELYKVTVKGKKLRHHCLMMYYHDIQNNWEKGKDANYLVLVPGYHGIFGLLDILEFYRYADDKVCKVIKKVLDR